MGHRRLFLLTLTLNLATLTLNLAFGAGAVQAQTSEQSLAQFKSFAKRIDDSRIRLAATTQNGRIKPLATLARETVLFLTGSFSKWGLSSSQMYLAMAVEPAAPRVPLIEIRGVELRRRLGFSTSTRYVSLADLESSELERLAQPILQKEKDGDRLTSEEKKVTEAYSQLNLMRQITSGQHLVMSLDFSWLNHGRLDENSEIVTALKTYLRALSNQNFSAAFEESAKVMRLTRAQPAPEMFAHALEKLETEVIYFDYRPFLWAGVFSILIGLAVLYDARKKRMSDRFVVWAMAFNLLPIIIGLALRVYITQFAPITNMYGTMVWVAFGVILFGLILFVLYGGRFISGLMLLGAGLILILTESFPLILSPDMDPIVAVLRSNFWLSTHVTTITISYAAFTIAMLLGNVTLIQSLIGQVNQSVIQEYFHSAYRMVQLGCFLLTVGIILGGVWADYSWGRFWGWDPKETWALIADLGFLALLHARFIGWVTPFGFLSLLPVAYLLVIMAWYGVNFILAAGLHSYGFSSGGALAVGVFVLVQLSLIGAAALKIRFSAGLRKSLMK